MIVNSTQSGWEVIYQSAHGLLAGQIAAHWRVKDRSNRWLETLAAIIQHDNGGDHWEGGNHLSEAGAPRDFTLSTSPSLKHPADAAATALYQGRWVALLMSRHLEFLYGHIAEELPEFAQFIEDQQQRQKRWQKELGVSVEEIERAYAIMQFSDRLSLILCQRQLPDGERALEICQGADGTRYEVLQRHDQTVTVMPWPFAEKSFTVSIEATCLSQFTFKDDAELQQALLSAPIDTLTWQFTK
jgi:hypothetical protein